MAVNTKLLLPSSATQPKVGGDYTKKLKVKVIRLDKLLKGSVAIKKDELNESKREESEDRKEKIEEKLETKPGKEKEKITKKIKPKMGIFGFIKNFIGNILLGFFAVRLVDQLPKLVAIASVVGKAADFVIDVGGTLLNGLASFIDLGYSVSEGTRDVLKNLGGEDVVGLFDGIIDKVSFLIDVLVISTLTGGKGIGDFLSIGGDFVNRLAKFKIPKLPSISPKDLKKLTKRRGPTGIDTSLVEVRQSRAQIKKDLREEREIRKQEKFLRATSPSRKLIRKTLTSSFAEERSSQLKKKFVPKTQQQINKELIASGYEVGQGGKPTPRDGRILRKMTKESDPNVVRSLSNNLSSAKQKRVSTRRILETSGIEGPVTLARTRGAQISARTFEVAERLARKGDANSLKKADILLRAPGSPQAKRILRQETDVFRRAARPKALSIAGAESSGVLRKLRGARGAFALETVLAGVDFYERTQQGQTVGQASAGAVSGAVAGTAGFTAASAIAAKILAPVLAVPIPGARLLYGLGVLGAGVMGSMGLGGIVTSEVDKLTGVEQRNEGGPIRRAPEIETNKKPKQISPPQPTRFDPDGDARITEMSKRLDKVDYFGPILGITGKILMGQSPDSQDYRNVGLGLSGFIQRASLLGLVQSINGS